MNACKGISFLFFFLLLATCSFNCISQSKQIDSLKAVLKTAKEDTNKVKALVSIASKLGQIGSNDTSLLYLEIAKKLAEELSYKTGLAKVYMRTAIVYYAQGHYPETLKSMLACLTIWEELGDKSGLAASYNGLGAVYYSLGNYPESLKNYFAALEIAEALNDKQGISACYNNIGLVYKEQGNLPEALKNYMASLKIDKQRGDKGSVADSYNNIGVVYGNQGNYTEALKNLFGALQFYKELGSKNGVANCYAGIATIYFQQKDYAGALQMSFNALPIREEIGDKAGIANSFIGLSNTYIKLNNYKEAETYCTKALSLAKETGGLDIIRDANKSLSEIYTLTSKQAQAFEFYKAYIAARDSLNNKENTKKSVQTQMQYEFDKKEASVKMQQDIRDKIQETEAKKQRIVLILVSCFLALVLVLALVILRSLRINQKKNQIIQEQKDTVEKQKLVVEQQKELVEEKQNQIVGSINYAKRIQHAILADEDEIKKYLKDFFVLYLPKDIVSGDFYWFAKKGSELFFATVDCTGHGVPGAFLSMIGSTLLNEIVNLKNITDPYTIIASLGDGVTNTLANKQDKSKSEAFVDGMDISICKIDIETRMLNFASVNHSAFVVNDLGLSVLSPQVKSVHGVFALSSKIDLKTTEVVLKPGSMIYMSTDGYADQVGGQEKKKLMMPRFKEVLAQAYKLPIEEQKALFEKTFLDWKGNRKQNDDILVMGFKIP